MNLPPEIVGGEEWDDADIQLQEWLEERRKKELARWRNYYAN